VDRETYLRGSKVSIIGPIGRKDCFDAADRLLTVKRQRE